jgi:hypothetical protein
MIVGKATTAGGKIPRNLWGRASMRAFAEIARATVVTRVSRRGEGLDDNPLKRYATAPRIYVYRAYGAGARLKPKGGRTVSIVKGLDGKFRKLKGHAYEGGYAEYKATSTEGGGGIVDLTLSEQMLRDFRVKDTTATRAVLGLVATWKYGRHVNARRPWIGLSRRDVQQLTEAMRDLIGSGQP